MGTRDMDTDESLQKAVKIVLGDNWTLSPGPAGLLLRLRAYTVLSDLDLAKARAASHPERAFVDLIDRRAQELRRAADPDRQSREEALRKELSTLKHELLLAHGSAEGLKAGLKAIVERLFAEARKGH